MPRNSRPPPLRNQLLAALPVSDYKRLLPHLESVSLPFMGILYESGEPINHVYFPNDGLISLLVAMADKAPREIALVGREGMLGIAVVLGMNTTPTGALIQLKGSAMRMKAQTLRDELKQGGMLQHLLQRYAHALLTQVSQSAACAGAHGVDKRLSRLLLLTHDGATGDEFELTQEFMAMLLGVTRSVVTRAAGRFQSEKMIHYARGQVSILDRRGLEATACECYEVIKEANARSAQTAQPNA